MPRNVRNFWVELDVDGRKSKVAAGPVSKDGGFNLTVKMRDGGEIIKPLAVRGWVRVGGKLALFINGEEHIVTER